MSQWKEGEFCWLEIATSDVTATKDFYSKIFKWEYQDFPMPQGTYTMWKVAGIESGGLYELNEDQKSNNVPPHWANYILSNSADAFTDKAKSLGGTVLAPPFDVGDMGRMSIMADPTGAPICTWQAKENKKHQAPRFSHGKVAWRELLTDNVEKAGKFYCDLCNWNIESQEMGEQKYHTFKVEDNVEAGMMEKTAEMGNVPNHWLTYFNTDDCKATVATAEKLGAKVCKEPTEIPNMCVFSVLTDPAGAAFGIMEIQNKG